MKQPAYFTGFVQGVPDKYKPMIVSASAQSGVPTDVLSAVLKAESNYDENVINGKITSSTGAQGIGQFMPDTAKGLGINPLDPSQAIPATANYLAGKYKQHGNSWDLAMAAYNAGSGNVEKYGGIPPFPETQRYIQKINDMRRVKVGTDGQFSPTNQQSSTPTQQPITQSIMQQRSQPQIDTTAGQVTAPAEKQRHYEISKQIEPALNLLDTTPDLTQNQETQMQGFANQPFLSRILHYGANGIRGLGDAYNAVKSFTTNAPVNASDTTNTTQETLKKRASAVGGQ